MQIFCIIAGILLDATKGHLYNTRDDLVQEVTIMGDYDHSTFPAGKIGFKPLQGRKVKVVRRLIQQQKVRFLQEQFTKGRSRLLSTAKLYNGSFLLLSF